MEEKNNGVKNEEYVTLSFKDIFDGIFKIAMVGCIAFGAVQLNGINSAISSGTVGGIAPQTQETVQESQEDEYAAYTEAVLSSEYGTSHSLDISSMMMSDMFQLEEGEYFVFFYMNGCGYCHMTMPYLLEYIESGRTHEASLYLAEISGEGADNFWSTDGIDTPVTPDEFRIVGTPTMLHVKDGQYEAVIGPEAIASMLGL